MIVLLTVFDIGLAISVSLLSLLILGIVYSIRKDNREIGYLNLVEKYSSHVNSTLTAIKTVQLQILDIPTDYFESMECLTTHFTYKQSVSKLFDEYAEISNEFKENKDIYKTLNELHRLHIDAIYMFEDIEKSLRLLVKNFDIRRGNNYANIDISKLNERQLKAINSLLED